MVLKPYKQWEKLPTSTGSLGYQPSTVVTFLITGNECCKYGTLRLLGLGATFFPEKLASLLGLESQLVRGNTWELPLVSQMHLTMYFTSKTRSEHILVSDDSNPRDMNLCRESPISSIVPSEI